MQTPIDNRMVQTGNGSGTCANIKAAGITIYTIQVNTDGDPTSTLLQNCASDPSKFFMLTSANQIVTTFQAIATNLTQVQRDDLDPHGTGFPKSHDVPAGPISRSKTSCQGGTPSGYRQASPPVNALATTSERRKRQRWTVRRPLMRTR